MTREQPAVPAPSTIAEVHQLYGWQSRYIDGGRAADWAATFTADGEFHSPSYPEPVAGTAALTEFAAAFREGARAANEVRRHVVTNIAVLQEDSETLTVGAYLQIVATAPGEASRLVRMTTLEDRLERTGGRWLVAHRRVSRDDTPWP
ncbi:nuclear transport factor 2 family protein [Nocardia blacklockiae]|uniref:nuclear transport factor 2 family protein n=1 Tax=Nocardia blacklockiae TaxID=480036 RepID=UPI00189332C3|nr:nuclear transport factor 2 family protein [Nocardia blacklockiae]MBF6170680.1 nuclear transport factor 2 family protein [Nocardia blacklockiae]